MSRARPAVTLLLALVAGLLLSVGLAACGGQKIAADEVTAPPPELTVPDAAEAEGDPLADEASGDEDTETSTTETSPDADADAGDSGDTPAGGGAAESPGSATGGSQAPAQPQATPAPTQAPAEDSPQQDSPPPAGSGAEKFEEFCQQNAGAC